MRLSIRIVILSTVLSVLYASPHCNVPTGAEPAMIWTSECEDAPDAWYGYSTMQLTVTEAEVACEQINATLVSNWNAELDTCVKDLLTNSVGAGVYTASIGAKYFNDSGSLWAWSDRVHRMESAQDYNHCNAVDNGICTTDEGNCLAATLDPATYTYSWSNVNCSLPNDYICEYRCPQSNCAEIPNCNECEYTIDPDTVECTECISGYYQFGATTNCYRMCDQTTYEYPWILTCEDSPDPVDIQCKFETTKDACLYFSETFNLVVPSDIMQYINFDKRKIKYVNAHSFDGIEYSLVSKIYLDDNLIEDIPSGIFDGFTEVTELWLDFNFIKQIPEDLFKDMTKLQQLRIPGNAITSLPVNVFNGLNDLEILYIYSNQIVSLPDNLFSGLSKLTWLFAGFNNVGYVGDGNFEDLTALEHLSLEDNNITYIAEGTFSGLTNLIDLDLARNPCTYAPTQCNGRTQRSADDKAALMTCHCD